MVQEYDISVEGRAYLLRPDTPKEGLLRQPRAGETADELSEPLRSNARESNLIMRPPSVTPNTAYILEATEYAQQQGRFLEFHHAAYKAYWEDGKDLGDLAVIGPIKTDVRPIQLEDGEDVVIGSELLLIGYPAETEKFPQPTITKGLLSRYRQWDATEWT